MLSCITCCKQKEDRIEGGHGTPGTKESVKTLTEQIKDMALKASGSHKNSKPITPPGSHRRIQMPYPHDFDPSHPRFARASADQVMPLEEEEPKDEWIAQVEHGIQITFASLPQGGNDLKRIRFSRDIFNKFEAQQWWGENYDRIMELYNVQRINRQALDTPARSDNGRDSSYSRLGSARESPMMTRSTTRDWSRNQYKPGSYSVGAPPGGEFSSMDPSRTTTSSHGEGTVPFSNACDMDTEWIQEDEPGVYITIRQLPDGTRELRRVRFSREQFGELHAKNWWDSNKERIQAEYL